MKSLAPIKLKVAPVGLPGRVTLPAPMGGERIKVWQNADRTGEVVLPKEWNSVTNVPSVLHVEGVTNSITARDIALTLTYDENPPNQNNPLFKCEDRVRLTIVKVDLEGYEAWRENDGDVVPADEEEDPGFLVTQKYDVVGGSYDPLEAKIIAKGLIMSSGVTRWLRFSDHTKVRLWRTGWTPAGIVPPSAEIQINSAVDEDHEYEVWMEGTWAPGTSVTVELFLKDVSGNEIYGCSDTVRLLGPVIMPIGNSMTFGYRRRKDLTPETPNWSNPWTIYPTDADWSAVSGTKDNPDYQGWRGYLQGELNGFVWEGEDPNGHGPEHMGYSGARTTHINGLLANTSRAYPINAYKMAPCYAIVIYFVGLNDIVGGRSSAEIYADWQSGLDTILRYRVGRGKTLVVGVTLPKMRVDYAGYTPVKQAELMALNVLIEAHTITSDHAKYVFADAKGIPHDVNDDGLHFLATGYSKVMAKILDAIKEGLK